MAWAKEEAKLETMKYKEERQSKAIQITFHADRQLDYDKQKFFRGRYLFLQPLYYGLQSNKICRKLKAKYKVEYDINAILSDLIYSCILEPTSKRSSFIVASEFLEKPSYKLHDIYHALDILGNECDFIQSEVYKNSHFLGKRNDKVLYYDCTNYSNGYVYGWWWNPSCFFSFSRKRKRTDITKASGEKSTRRVRLSKIHILQRFRTGF